MKEVSCRVFQGVFALCPKHGIGMEKVMAGVPVPVSYLANPRNRMDWNVWTKICRNVAGGCRNKRHYVELAGEWARDESRTMFRRAAWAFASPERAYRFFCGSIVPSTYRHLKSEFRQETEKTYIFSIWISPEYEGCVDFFISGEGVIAMVPTFIGLPPSSIEPVEVGPHRGVYRITLPASRTLWSQLRKVWRLVTSPARSQRLLQERNEEIERSYVELERQAKEFRGVLEASGDALAVVREGRILYANPALAELLRVPAAANLIGATTDRWLAPGEIARLRAWGAEAGSMRARSEARLRLSEHDTIVAEFSPPRQIVWADEPAALWQIVDVTERRALEQALAEASHREQQRIAHDLHDGLGQILTGAAFKAQALENALLGESNDGALAARELVVLINEATGQARDLAHRLAPVTDSARTFGVTLRHLAMTTAGLFGIRCEYAQSGAEPVLSAQAAIQLYRVVQEALTNAIRHGRAEWIEIFLANEGLRLELSVTDRGRGMPAEFHDKKDGGMGLRIMRYRIESLGGTLTFEPREGGGTQVRMAVPLSVAPAEAVGAEVAQNGNADPAKGNAGHGVRRVVLIDDHPVVRAGVRQLLSQHSDIAVCGEAESTTEAEAVCARLNPDVALVDMLLDAQGNSLGLIRRLRKARPGLRIVVLSMYAEEIYAEAAREAGVDAYVMKQARADVLVAAVRGSEVAGAQ